MLLTTEFVTDFSSSLTPSHAATPSGLSGIEGWVPAPRRGDLATMLTSTGRSTRQTTLRAVAKETTSRAVAGETLHRVAPPSPTARATPATPPRTCALTREEEECANKSALNKDSTIPGELPIKPEIGKFTPLMEPQGPYGLSHAATPLLEDYAAHGCPVDCGPNWSRQQIVALLLRGPHRSAMQRRAIQQLRTETTEKTNQGYARIVQWGGIKDDIPPKLKISPVAMIPHKSKAFRCILDLSFELLVDGETITSVNARTHKRANQQAMDFIGSSIKRIVYLMEEQWDGPPFVFAKLDVKDGFWRMAVSDDDAWNFCYVLPSLNKSTNIDDIEIVVPNSLQMGWCESPPFFCSASETARDIMDNIRHKPLPPHEFEHRMLPQTTVEHRANATATTAIEVYVDDFIGVTNDASTEHLTALSRAMLHGVHAVFPPPQVTGHAGGDPISEKKLDKGEGKWSTAKEILGWEFDGVAKTIKLPTKKWNDIRALIRRVLKGRTATLHKFQRMAGKLQHAAFGIPGGKSLFTPIDVAMKGDPAVIPITPELRQCIEDWRVLIQIMHKAPVSVRQLVIRPPCFIGYSDACRLGAGGVWCSGTHTLEPFLWAVEWPQDIQDALITDSNPGGSITINELELAGALLSLLALETWEVPLLYAHLAWFGDNITSVAWAYRLRNSRSRVAGFLLRFIGLRLHKLGASNLIPHHIAGEENVMADFISRAFKNGIYFKHAPNGLVPYFNTTFPLQSGSWAECRLPTALVSSVIACLRGELLPMASLLRRMPLGKNTGATGSSTQLVPESTPSLAQPSLPSSATLSQEHLLLGSGQVATDLDIESRLAVSRTHCQPSPRPSSWLEGQASSTAATGNISSSSSG